MPTIKQFLLPDPAEGLTEADIVSWKVKVGDTVRMNQPIVEIETAKSLVELPSPYAGVVVEIHVEEGVTAQVGSPIISIDIDPDGPPADSAGPSGTATQDDGEGRPEPDPTARTEASTQPDQGAASEESSGAGQTRQSVLVGYGPKTGSPKRRPRRAWPKAFGPGSGVAASAANVLHDEFSAQRPVSMPVAPPPPPRPVQPVGDSGRGGLPPVGTVNPPPLPPDVRAKAKPPVRKLARDLGVDLATVGGTGKDGVVTRADVEAVARAADVAAAPAPAEQAGEERIRIAGVRKVTAETMVRSAFTAPHVTEWVSVDVTGSLELLRKLRARKEFEGVKLTPLVLVARALCLAIRRHPGVNASWDDEAGEIVLKRYVNLGIATATPRGLLVPNIKDAHTLDVRGLAQALSELTRTARDGATPPSAMRGGTITITNVGVFGVDGGTPIINPPESAILAMGQVRPMPWVVDGELAVRQVMQLTLSFDHRLVDGELGSRVLADIAAVLEAPELALAWL